MSTPTSIINVCAGVRINNSYRHTIWFDSSADQIAYFAEKVVKTFSAYTYLRKSWSIKVAATMQEARAWNYLYFSNNDGKTYFYFINQIEYINDNTVELFLELDVMQSYLFSHQLNKCFVEREHAETDEPGDNTVDEGLELGELVTIDTQHVSLGSLCLLILATYDPATTTEENTNAVVFAEYHGVFSGLGLYAVSAGTLPTWGLKLSQLDSWGKSDGIVAMWMYPQALIELEDGETWGSTVTNRVKTVKPLYHDLARNTMLHNDYIPKHKKLLTYPFNFLYITNNSGTAAALRYERFGDPTACNFKVVGGLSPDGVVKAYPLNYNGEQHAYDSGVSLGGFPSCAWNQDIYKMWLAQNQSTQNLAMVSGALKIAGGAATAVLTGGMGAAAGAGAALSGVADIAGLMAQRADMELQPPQARGQASSNVNIAAGFQTITMQKRCVSAEYAYMIDDFFHMYGYATKRVKTPNRHVRKHWTYTKTRGCQVIGNFCNEDLSKLESIYDQGITFWVNGDDIGNYGYFNQCIGSSGDSPGGTDTPEVEDQTALKITAQPVNVTAAVGSTVQFTVMASNVTSYQWQNRLIGSSDDWANSGIDGCNTATISIPVIAMRYSYEWRCLLTGADGSTLATDAVVIINPDA